VSPLDDQLGDYLRIRRALGYKLARTEKLLVQFIAFLQERGERVITIENTLAWVTLPGGSDSWRAVRLSAVRGFAAYLHALDDGHELPPADLCPSRPARATLYPYSDQQIAALMAATVILRGRLRQSTYRTLIGLLAVTGMRVGEAIRLDRDDVDLAHGVLTVRDTKFGKSRELPVHPSTVSALRDYTHVRDRLCPEPATEAVLSHTQGLGCSTAPCTPRSSNCVTTQRSGRARRPAVPGFTTSGTGSLCRHCSTGTGRGSTCSR
jgi:integrase/recombinase XerD